MLLVHHRRRWHDGRISVHNVVGLLVLLLLFELFVQLSPSVGKTFTVGVGSRGGLRDWISWEVFEINLGHSLGMVVDDSGWRWRWSDLRMHWSRMVIAAGRG